MSSNVKESFAKELTKDDEQINLAYAALLMSEYLTGAFDVSLYLTLLDDMTETIQTTIALASTDREIVELFNQYLFKELKFVGNSKNYYNPSNSFLNKVLDLRTGIPISLSVIYLEVGWRLGLPLWGIGLPGHFIVGYGSTNQPIYYIDVFNQGQILSEETCLALCQVPMARLQSFKEEFLKPVSKRVILFRMLLNLKQIFVTLEDWEATYNTVDLMIVVQPDQTTEIRDRGLVAYRLNLLQAAIFDIERYLFLAPDNTDEAWLKQHLEMMEEKLLLLN